ncbi:MAG: efflux RND transporter periplasmic adaptor subunit [Duganella sp.]
MNTKQKSIVAALAALAIIAPLAYTLAGQGATPAGSTSPVSVAAPAPASPGPGQLRFAAGAPQLAMIRVRALAAGAAPASDMLSARIVYDEDVTARLGVAVAGRVVRIAAAPGDRVRAGQVLADIDAPEAGVARADLDKARADETVKRLAAERARALVAGEGIAGKDIEAAEAELALARAETARATLRVQSLAPAGARVQGQRIGLASPVAGVVVERTVTPALEVSPDSSAPLFVVTDPKQLWLLIDVPEALAAKVQRGMRVGVESDAHAGQRFSAVVAQPGQLVDADTRRVTVRARLDNRDGKLLPGMYVRAALLEAAGSAVRVPNGALVNRGLYTYVFVEKAPGLFQRRQVTLQTRGGDASYVAEGLADNERVVTDGALLLDAEMSARAGDAP